MEGGVKLFQIEKLFRLVSKRVKQKNGLGRFNHIALNAPFYFFFHAYFRLGQLKYGLEVPAGPNNRKSKR